MNKDKLKTRLLLKRRIDRAQRAANIPPRERSIRQQQLAENLDVDRFQLAELDREVRP